MMSPSLLTVMLSFTGSGSGFEATLGTGVASTGAGEDAAEPVIF